MQRVLIIPPDRRQSLVRRGNQNDRPERRRHSGGANRRAGAEVSRQVLQALGMSGREQNLVSGLDPLPADSGTEPARTNDPNTHRSNRSVHLEASLISERVRRTSTKR